MYTLSIILLVLAALLLGGASFILGRCLWRTTQGGETSCERLKALRPFLLLGLVFLLVGALVLRYGMTKEVPVATTVPSESAIEARITAPDLRLDPEQILVGTADQATLAVSNETDANVVLFSPGAGVATAIAPFGTARISLMIPATSTPILVLKQAAATDPIDRAVPVFEGTITNAAAQTSDEGE